jgi:hypothetical protein
VTRLGEFSVIGWYFSLGSFLPKYIHNQPTFLGYFFPRLRFYIHFGTKCVGLHFGQFLTKSSGHPAVGILRRLSHLTDGAGCLSMQFAAITFFLNCFVITWRDSNRGRFKKRGKGGLGTEKVRVWKRVMYFHKKVLRYLKYFWKKWRFWLLLHPFMLKNMIITLV